MWIFNVLFLLFAIMIHDISKRIRYVFPYQNPFSGSGDPHKQMLNLMYTQGKQKRKEKLVNDTDKVRKDPRIIHMKLHAKLREHLRYKLSESL